MNNFLNYQNDPEAPEVAGFVVSCALKKFRRSVLQRKAGRLQGGAARRAQAGESKVYYLQDGVLPLICKQHILQDKIQCSSSCLPLYSQTSGQHRDDCNLIHYFLEYFKLNRRKNCGIILINTFWDLRKTQWQTSLEKYGTHLKVNGAISHSQLVLGLDHELIKFHSRWKKAEHVWWYCVNVTPRDRGTGLLDIT